MSADDELVAWLRKASSAIYLATEKDVADDVAPKLKEAADRLARLTAALTAERERCAKVADKYASARPRNSFDSGIENMADQIANEIRSLPDEEG